MGPAIKEPRSVADERGSLEGDHPEVHVAKRRPVSAAIIGAYRELASNEGVLPARGRSSLAQTGIKRVGVATRAAHTR